MAVHDRVLRPDSERTTVATTKCTKGGCKLDGGRRMPGAGLSRRSPRKAPLGQSAFQPYWGKLAVRNDRGDRGNVGIIRSPISASILPDSHSDVPSQAHSARLPISTGTHREVLALMVRAEEKAGPEDVGEQALMRGLDTAFPFFVWGCPWSSVGRRSDDRPHNGFQEFPCRGPAFTSARLMSATIPRFSLQRRGLWAGRAHLTTRAVHSPRATLRLSMCHELAIDRPNEGG